MTAKQPADDETTASGRSRVWVLLSPGLRDVAVLLTGAVLGLLAGPMVLGQLHPDAYRNLFIGARAERQAYQVELETHTRGWEVQFEQLNIDPDAPDIESWMEHYLETRDRQRQEIEEEYTALIESAKAAWEKRLRGIGQTLVLAGCVVLVIGGVLGGRLAYLKPRFITAVCAVLAVWLLLHAGRPELLGEVPAAFAAVVAAIAIIAALLPLPRGET